MVFMERRKCILLFQMHVLDYILSCKAMIDDKHDLKWLHKINLFMLITAPDAEHTLQWRHNEHDGVSNH